MIEKNGSGIYNSRLFLVFFEYFEYKGIPFDEVKILQKAGIEKLMLFNHDYWLPVDQADRFYEACVEACGNENLAHEAGRFIAQSIGISPFRQYLLGHFSMRSLYLNFASLYSIFARDITIISSKIKGSRAELVVIPAGETKQKKYQCDFRKGILEAIGKFYTGKMSQVKNDNCAGQDKEMWKYIVTWEKSSFSWLIIVRRFFLGFSGVVLAVLFFFFKLRVFIEATILFTILSLILTALLYYCKSKKQESRLKLQGTMAHNYISEIDYRHRQALIIREISNVSTAVLDLNLFLQTIMRIFSRYTPYDRGMVLLFDHGEDRLLYRAGYGFHEKEENLLRETEFFLGHEHLAGLAALAFNEKEPFVVNDIEEIKSFLSGEMGELFDELGGMSFICLPLYLKKRPRGVLYLGNREKKHTFSRGEIDFFRGITSQVAVAISNTESVEKLSLSEERLLLAMEATSDAIWDWDFSVDDIYVSPRGYEMMGFTAGEVRPTFENWLEIVHPDEQEKTAAIVKEALEKESDYYSLDFRVDTKRDKHEYRWFQVKARIVERDEGGKAKRAVGTIIDVNDSRLAAEELLRQKKKAEESDKLKTAFLANMSHEIRTPMNAIIGYTELLQQEELLPRHIEYLDIIHKSGNILLSLVSDILDMSRIEAGHMEVLLQPFDLRSMLKNLLSSTDILLLDKKEDVACELTIDENIAPLIIGDELRLFQVINNLLGNSVKFTSSGKIKLSVFLYEGWLEVKVTDTGIGIASEQQEKIFKRFQQAENDTSRRYGGTGLGLTITMLLVEIMGGDISVFSEGIPGRGSVFTIKLPYNPVENFKPADKFSPENEFFELAGGRVLLVEDNPVNQLLTRRILERQGLSVDIAHNGSEALDFMDREGEYNLIFMDLEMPVMDGFEAISRIRSKEENQGNVPIIALTAHAMSNNMKRCRDLGCNDFITKPVNLGKITQILIKYLSPEKVQR